MLRHCENLRNNDSIRLITSRGRSTNESGAFVAEQMPRRLHLEGKSAPSQNSAYSFVSTSACALASATVLNHYNALPLYLPANNQLCSVLLSRFAGGEDWLGVQTRALARLPVKWLRCVNICISYAVSIWNWSGNAPVTALFLSLHFQSVTFGQCTHVESHPPFGTNRQNPRGKADSKRVLSHGEPRLICLMTVSPHWRAQNRAHMPWQ